MNIHSPIDVHTQLFIDGEFVDALDGSHFRTVNPATGQVLAEVSEAGTADVDRAVAAARRALSGPWSMMALADRARVIRRIAELLEQRLDALADLEALDCGMPVRDTREQVLDTAAWFEFFADMGRVVRSSVIPTLPGYFTYTLQQPIGVIGLIIPWNYPLPLCGNKMPAALAMGNTLVLKPAEQTPLTALALADICREAGVPDGVVNVVPGYGHITGRALVEHPDVGMISFTGSTEVGREIAASCGRQLKRVALELGGKSPNIVFADADLDQAAATSLFTFAVHQGQLCSAGSRLLVEEPVHDAFVAELCRRAEALRVGDPLDPNTQLGAVISAEQLARIEGYVETASAEGAHRLTGSGRPRIPHCEEGWFYTPTIFTDVESRMRIAQEEVFGPVLSVIAFRDVEHAAMLANDVLYGLAAGIWTRDVARVHDLAARIEAGFVHVNSMNVLTPNSPYGGWKQSGLGHEGGIEQCIDVTRLKTVWVNLANDAPSL
jgi:acyl-CoA reductase-like NAD-dependent aldehyde dehydrogenase